MNKKGDHEAVVIKPTRQVIVVYGIISFWVLIFITWKLSFIWSFVFGFHHYMAGLFVFLLAMLLFSKMIGSVLRYKINQLIVISIVQLVFLWLLAFPVGEWQIKSSFVRAQATIDHLEVYKKQTGTYPDDLRQLKKALGYETPRLTNLGTTYKYQILDNGSYRLWFDSYHGYKAHYNQERDDWFFDD